MDSFIADITERVTGLENRKQILGNILGFLDLTTLEGTDNHNRISALCKNHNVRSLFAFGSVVTDRFNDKSDIDLLVSFNPMDFGDYADTYFELVEKFEKLFKRQVDLVTDKSLKNPYFIDSVNQTKTLLYEC